MKLKQWLGLGLLLAVAATVSAAPIEVGSGVNEAKIYIEWADGFSAEFLVRFGQSEAETTTGLELLDIIEAETELVTERTDYDWGITVDGITYQNHNDVGYGGGDFWWHYWTDDAGSRENWISPWTGASGRIVRHGRERPAGSSAMETPMPGFTAMARRRNRNGKSPSSPDTGSTSRTPTISPPPGSTISPRA